MGRTLEQYKHLRESRKRERELLGYNTPPKEIWNTESVYVDRDTGEIILKRQLENGEYIKLKTTTKYTNHGRHKNKTITTECEQSKQGRLWT